MPSAAREAGQYARNQMNFRRCRVIAIILVLVISFVGEGSTSDDRREAAIRSLFGERPLSVSSFSKTFVDSVGLQAVRSQVVDILTRLGSLQSIVESGKSEIVILSRGTIAALVRLDRNGGIESLNFSDETSSHDTSALNKVLGSRDSPDSNDFTPNFLSSVPLNVFLSVKAKLLAAEGRFLRVEIRKYAYYAVFANAENHVIVRTDERGRISFCQIQPAMSRASSLQKALQDLRTMGGTSSYIVISGRDRISSYRPDVPLAVGSAFKLAVLVAVREKIQVGGMRWDTVNSIHAIDKSVPSGTYQNWPVGLPVTIATFAAQMISISDNTAADALARIVGRNALERISPRNRPFLTTREVFSLQHAGPEHESAYLHADIPRKRRLLLGVDREPLPGIDGLANGSSDAGPEWYFSVRELCTLMVQVEDLDLMTIAPGIVGGDWRRIAFKGGSDVGVLNLTSFVTSHRGRNYCVSATWNDRGEIDLTSRSLAFAGVLDQLSRR